MSTLVDIAYSPSRISVPVPLKHHTETAYIVLLALVTALSGFVASLLPHVPAGLPAWSICMTLAVLYPIVLMKPFRENRADYEFRALHWLPSVIFFLWILFEYIGTTAKLFTIIQLGLFFLWSLPLVALTVALLITFSVHVIRRWTVRVALLSLILGFFAVGSVVAETWNINPRLQRGIFSETTGLQASLRHAGGRGIRAVRSLFTSNVTGSDATQSSGSTSSQKSAVALVPPTGLPPAITDRKPRGLASSGPEDIALLFLTLLAGYSITLHTRARRRLEA